MMDDKAVARLRAVREFILKEPGTLDMDRFRSGCGTVGCIAFQLCKAEGVLPPVAFQVRAFAENLLSLQRWQADLLFMPQNIDLYSNPGTPEHAERVARHIDGFIESYGPLEDC